MVDTIFANVAEIMPRAMSNHSERYSALQLRLISLYDEY